ncbi:MAG: BrnT family toxin [Acidobacteriota bacterium]
MVYEWDPRKAAANFRKHRVAFTEAATVFLDPLAVTYQDPDHSETEHRYITVGESTRSRVTLVSHLDRRDRIRIISARRATRKEAHEYREAR